MPSDFLKENVAENVAEDNVAEIVEEYGFS